EPGRISRVSVLRKIEVLERDGSTEPFLQLVLTFTRVEMPSREILSGAPKGPTAVNSQACLLQGNPRNVGSHDAGVGGEAFLFEQNCQRVGLLAGGAAGAQEAKDVIRTASTEDFGQDLPAQEFKL